MPRYLRLSTISSLDPFSEKLEGAGTECLSPENIMALHFEELNVR